MIIGLTLLGLVVVLLIFGVAGRVFKNIGVSYPVAFVLLGVLIGCAFIPTFYFGSVAFNVAGSIAPAVISAGFLVLSGKLRETGHALVAMTSVMALYIAAELVVSPYTSAVVAAVVCGVSCGGVAYIVGKTRLAAAFACFLGIPVGDIVASAVELYAYGTPIRIGAPESFDAVVFSAVFAIALYEAVAAIKRARTSRRRAAMEAAEEFDPDEYKRYFNE